ncbi:MAG: DUF952 domain-containing protein [Rhodospirillales bacterium]|nr:DUF952 domain-containing protein [Rhodospirillales bacterium]
MCRWSEWAEAARGGHYGGSSQDAADGFIHFSTADQLPGSAARHRAGQSGLCLLVVEAASLGAALRWEPSRGGELFPHLHDSLPVTKVVAVYDLPLDEDGRPLLPALED